VKINITDNKEIASSELVNYLRQTPNHEVLGFLKLQLATYNMSGNDTTKWYNRWSRKLGQAPEIYDQQLTDASVFQLRQALINRGYMDASVEVDTVINKKKIDVTYNVTTGRPHYIATLDYNIPDSAINALVMSHMQDLNMDLGDLLDRTKLDEERVRIAELLRDNGYYYFNKEYITFTADTAAGAKDVNVVMSVRPPVSSSASNDTGAGKQKQALHQVYYIKNVIFVTDYNAAVDYGSYNFANQDTVSYKDLTILYGKDRYLRPGVLYDACYIRPGEKYVASQVNRTYESLGRLGILRYVNIEMRPTTSYDGKNWLDAYILLTRGKKQSMALDLEGTNSEGDLGFGVGVTYQHRNLARGSELLTAKLRTSYESLSGDFSGLINNRYMEYAGEVGITFPEFVAPFLSSQFKKRISANTEFSTSFNYQERPEYTRIIAGIGWKYRWANRQNTHRQRFDLIDLNYVYLPKSTIDFIDQIAPTNPLLRYSYEDHFITRMGYSYYQTNKRVASASSTLLQKYSFQPTVFTLRANIETAGNLLYAISSAIGQHRDQGVYKIFGIQYAQYVKGDADYTHTHNFDTRNSLAFHVGVGIGVPYGNSTVMPFEKRFYAGGANSVRGWGVRTLGPGSYDAKNSVTDFINQCGDIRLDLNLEYRAKLFWVMEGALFVDAGNIWTIHNYENQPGGMFKFNKFYKEIAAAYGAGLRLDFTYFLLRFDLGIKAYNPAQNQERWPLLHPRWGRDTTFHFSVGYPF
jgi:outer membrane protein assembly factor BamA